MSNISVNITELKQLLEATPASHNIMLVGNHGIGKSEILTEFFKEKGMQVVALFLGQMADPGDLIGLPTKDEKTGKTDFIDENRIWLDKDPDAKEGVDTGLDKTPDRRAWKRVSDVILGKDELKEIETKTIASIVGPKAASAFIQNAATRKILSGREILAGFDKAKVKDALAEYGVHQLSVVNEGIYRHLEVEKVQDKDVKKYADNLMNYFEFLTKKRKEAAAHFANTYAQQTYQEAIAFIATKCPMLVMMLVSYVKGIKMK